MRDFILVNETKKTRYFNATEMILENFEIFSLVIIGTCYFDILNNNSSIL